MFIKTTQFKKLLKELYTGTGVEVFNTGEELRIGGGYWIVAVKAGKINKENLAAIIEFTGNLPEPGRGFCAGKDRKNQGSFKLQAPIERNVDDELYISRINFRYGNDVSLRILQGEDRKIYLLKEDILKLIDVSKLETEETTPNGPFLMTGGVIEWSNNIMTLQAMPVESEDFKAVINALETIPEGIV